MEQRYITTTLPYVNAKPHIGFALEIVQADVLARYWRLLGHEVFFNTGTDEHGQKIWEKAQEEGEDTQTYVDRHVASVQSLKTLLDLSFDNFIRTTDESHIKAAQELWKGCKENGDIEKKKFKGLYCVGCEKYLTERDLEGGKCPLHPGNEPIELEEENYFFKLSKHQQFLEEYLSDENVIIPEYRRQEALQFVKGGLEDFSISREKEKLPWGIPVPDDDEQVMYVWFDALTNYISTLGWPEDEERFNVFWQNGYPVQMAGKDQVRFQSIMWPAMLHSAGINPPRQIFYHGFINSGGHRMSKSLGNVIDPEDMVERYGVDATRFILLRHVHPTDDTDITWEKMDEWYTADLVNGLGNLVARVMKMAETHLDEPIALQKGQSLDDLGYEFQEAMDRIWYEIGVLDEKITETEPFKLVKEDKAAAQKIITELVQGIAVVGEKLQPFMPETAEKIVNAVKENKKPDNLFARLPLEAETGHLKTKGSDATLHHKSNK